ncbi:MULTISPECIES: flagellar protein export ATPase FliI [Methylosinus]|uniref:Flagellum-specific ATP synthase n=1 Tax=Methylosinus trichosporium (strain ATCC 35070 / NCIMB 11131 / UNIQEM 75 / OB3b) TaxID=595536 RepID=A0A2D2D3Z0_METT3|nr:MULTISPECIES: flagellar protein export ATPase FliI [Methylosinus]ATQ69685.1 flagellum-specific ATP synthase FliI [Methylosinus trichosporium OB3b]OBS51227.1 flagellar protein export ATPase FliI [Methylosinus sp. 3S-1]
MASLQRLREAVSRHQRNKDLARVSGLVTEVAASHCRVLGLSDFVELGECVRFGAPTDERLGQVVKVAKDGAIVKCFDDRARIGLNTPAFRAGPIEIAPHPDWIGRVLDAFGRPVDDRGAVSRGDASLQVDASAPLAMRRARVTTPVRTGVKAVDCFTPICAGQRIGVFAGSGVGKSTLLGMLARAPGFDLAVVCLVGERGREVREFLEEALAGAHARDSITIVATGDESPMMRRLAPLTATTVAEYFRDCGRNVLLIVDSVTRFAHASREVALAAGEPPVAHGYTPSVFADIPRLLERAGPGEEGKGTITGVFSVLVDGDNHNDPIADCVRGTLDGHIVLDRAIAEQGRYPAIDLKTSISRLAHHAWRPEQRHLIQKLRALVSRFEDTRDLRMLGGYQKGSDPELDQSVLLVPKLYEAVCQSPQSPPSMDPFREVADRLQQASAQG